MHKPNVNGRQQEKRMDEAKYGELLKEIRPRIIELPEEHERLLTIAENMMEKGDSLTEEEREALAMIVLLIEAFEAQVIEDDPTEGDEPTEGAEDEQPPPHIALQRLMASNRLELGDIASLFGTPGLAREAIEGRRPISQGQARELGNYFKVPAKLFQE
ncbi:MAG: hypothetical protein H7Y20_15160 [Bryobacteraceae bacterium]|nr:hypothetical protein [Bryobacteraceae bacterium]